MKILSVKNPQWVDASHTAINLSVTFEGLGEVPFTASASDHEKNGRDLFAQAMAGDFGSIASPPAASLDELKGAKRAALDALLGDWKNPRIALANGAGNPKLTFVGADQIQIVVLAWLALVSDPQGGAVTTLTDPDGNTGTVTKALLDSFVPAWVSERNRVIAAYSQRKAAVDAATSAAEVAAVDDTTPL